MAAKKKKSAKTRVKTYTYKRTVKSHLRKRPVRRKKR